MGTWPDPLKAAIDEAWRVFDLPAPSDLGVCTVCCMHEELEAEILATPARQLTTHHLFKWLWAVHSDRLTADKVRWLLPRLLELLASGELVSPIGQEIFLRRLPMVGFPENWPETQVRVVHDFCMALLDQKLAARDTELDSWLCMIAAGHLDITPFLDRTWSLPDPDFAALMLANWFGPDDRGWIMFTGHWEDFRGRTQVWNWFHSPELAQRLFRIGQEGDPRLLDLAAEVQSFEGRPPPD